MKLLNNTDYLGTYMMWNKRKNFEIQKMLVHEDNMAIYGKSPGLPSGNFLDLHGQPLILNFITSYIAENAILYMVILT